MKKNNLLKLLLLNKFTIHFACTIILIVQAFLYTKKCDAQTNKIKLYTTLGLKNNFVFKRTSIDTITLNPALRYISPSFNLGCSNQLTNRVGYYGEVVLCSEKEKFTLQVLASSSRSVQLIVRHNIGVNLGLFYLFKTSYVSLGLNTYYSKPYAYGLTGNEQLSNFNNLRLDNTFYTPTIVTRLLCSYTHTLSKNNKLQLIASVELPLKKNELMLKNSNLYNLNNSFAIHYYYVPTSLGLKLNL